MTIDFNRLRGDLLDYYGTASQSGFPMAMSELGSVECASQYELAHLAQNAGISLNDYVIEDDDLER